ncbi:hypothetical protein BD769DRAFT_1665149 [Suillus cothurnatus]|nr:hypothetical protein BD769DRAFT_1665149 [Suillus cothurnatus]
MTPMFQIWSPEFDTQVLAIEFHSHIPQHKLCNLVFTFYQTNKTTLKSMSREHLLLLKLSMLHSNFGGQNLWLASHRATQASHTGFHILQDNSSTIKVHVKRAPATPETE